MWYRDQMAWAVDRTENSVVLTLGRGMVAFDVPADWAFRVRNRLERNGFCTPALLVGARLVRAVFLAEADGVVLGQFQMPGDVRYLAAPCQIELPLLHVTAAQSRKWFCAPNPARRWLFPAGAVLAAVNAATPPPFKGAQPPDDRRSTQPAHRVSSDHRRASGRGHRRAACPAS
ncbi:hypothetical protein AB0I53_46275 [Saccharopolyspora sp. NPDC050389]|uniref:hypothetical protein n=1 Tax=Saccharopolyspora sp. NPDC050389 TaxID=3155516 RepID=UPI00341002B5